MSRPVQVGDYVTITTSRESQTYPIEHIEGLDIYISIGDGESSLLVQVNGDYQVEGLEGPHHINFTANETPTLSGNELIDLAILESLDDESLDIACQINDYTRQLCGKDELWNNKIISKFANGDEILGRKLLAKRSNRMSSMEHYRRLSSLSTADANLALAQYDKPVLENLENLGLHPDIPQKLVRDLTMMGFAIVPNTDITLFRLRDEVVDFLREAELGPQIKGSLIFNPETNLHEVDDSSIKAVRETRLNELIYFIRPEINGQPNPLYGLVTLFEVIGYLNLHIAYSEAFDGTHISATPLMREHLGGIMRYLIDQHVARIVQLDPERGEEAHQVGEQLKEAINDPTLIVDVPLFIINGRRLEIFNPNSFRFAQLSGLNRAFLVEQISPGALNALRPRIAEVYSLIPGIEPDNAPEKVNLVMDNMRHFAKAYQRNNPGSSLLRLE